MRRAGHRCGILILIIILILCEAYSTVVIHANMNNNNSNVYLFFFFTLLLPRQSSLLHVIGDRHIIRPHVELPLLEAEHAAVRSAVSIFLWEIEIWGYITGLKQPV